MCELDGPFKAASSFASRQLLPLKKAPKRLAVYFSVQQMHILVLAIFKQSFISQALVY